MTFRMRAEPSLFDVFWSKVRESPECWEWTGQRNDRGYGYLAGRWPTSGAPVRSRFLAHRISWEIANTSEIPEGLCALHRCDNPPCVRPDHLFLGTMKDNTRDMVAKGRARFFNGMERRGERSQAAKYTDAQINEVRAMLAAGRPPREIVRRNGMSKSHVYSIKYGWTRSGGTP